LLPRAHAFAKSPPLNSNPDYRPDIDGLRAIAVGGVVAFHAWPSLLPGGFVGVDVFFVVSGFLITGIILSEMQRDAFSFLEFYRRRVRRIVPALVVVLAATWTIGLFALWPNQFADLGTHILAASTFTSNFLLAAQAGYFDTSAAAKPLLHLWSLAIEEQFYLVWPALLFLVWKARLNIKLVLYAIVAASLASAAASQLSPTAWSFFGPQNRAWELGLGALLAIHRDLSIAAARALIAAIGIALIAISMVWLNAQSPYPGWRALAPTLGTALLILAGPYTPINRALSTPALVGIGLISYPLYLWHWPLLSFAHITANESWIVIAATVLASLLLAWLTFRVVELPIRRTTSKPFKHYAAPALLACLGAMAIFGIGTQASNGLAFRHYRAIQ